MKRVSFGQPAHLLDEVLDWHKFKRANNGVFIHDVPTSLGVVRYSDRSDYLKLASAHFEASLLQRPNFVVLTHDGAQGARRVNVFLVRRSEGVVDWHEFSARGVEGFLNDMGCDREVAFDRRGDAFSPREYDSRRARKTRVASFSEPEPLGRRAFNALRRWLRR